MEGSAYRKAEGTQRTDRKTDQSEDKPTTLSPHNRKRQQTQRNKNMEQILYRCAKCPYVVLLWSREAKTQKQLKSKKKSRKKVDQ